MHTSGNVLIYRDELISLRILFYYNFNTLNIHYIYFYVWGFVSSDKVWVLILKSNPRLWKTWKLALVNTTH